MVREYLPADEDNRDYDAIADAPLTRAFKFIADGGGFVGTASDLLSRLESSLHCTFLAGYKSIFAIRKPGLEPLSH